MTLSLANKYRPRKFSDVLGQGDIIKILGNILDTRSYPPALLFMGSWGSGKTTLARIFANAVLCQKRVGPEPCGVCDLCKQFLQDPDKVFNFREIDAASEGGVGNVRDIIEESHFRAVGDSKKKVLLIDECHQLTLPAQNAFLKLLEEGSENMLFLFCTTDSDKMLRTIYSRTLPFKIQDIPSKDIVERLKWVCAEEKIEHGEAALSTIVAVNKGHVRDCYMLLDKLRHGPGVSVEAIRRLLNLDLEAEYYRIVNMLTVDIGEVMLILNSLVQRATIREIYDGISRATLTSFKLYQGVETGLPESELAWCRKLAERLGERALRVARFLTSKVPADTLIALECDLLSLKHFIEKGFPDEPRQNLQEDKDIKFSSRIEELQYLERKKKRTPEEAEVIEAWEAAEILKGYLIEEE